MSASPEVGTPPKEAPQGPEPTEGEAAERGSPRAGTGTAQFPRVEPMTRISLPYRKAGSAAWSSMFRSGGPTPMITSIGHWMSPWVSRTGVPGHDSAFPMLPAAWVVKQVATAGSTSIAEELPSPGVNHRAAKDDPKPGCQPPRAKQGCQPPRAKQGCQPPQPPRASESRA